jgi:hypothetical protein
MLWPPAKKPARRLRLREPNRSLLLLFFFLPLAHPTSNPVQTSGAIPIGSLVLVTGANASFSLACGSRTTDALSLSQGFIASHVVEQLLAAGYKARGTASFG